MEIEAVALSPLKVSLMKDKFQGTTVRGGSDRLSSTIPPRLLFRHFHGEPPEPTGLRTPPLRLPGTIPFTWEVVPGKPREEPSSFGLGPNSGLIFPLELPPRLAAAVMEKAASAIASPRRSPDFQYQRSASISSCHGFPMFMSRSSRDRGGRRAKNYKERMFWMFFRRTKGKVDIALRKTEEICPSASSSELQPSPSSDKVHHEEISEAEERKKKKATITRVSRCKSVGGGQCVHSSSRFWGSIYGSFKKVVPWQMEYKKNSFPVVEMPN